jgi:hypothetical protein
MPSKRTRSVPKARNRPIHCLSLSLEKNLLAYAAAASATLLPAAIPAEAEIVYTPSNAKIVTAKLNAGPTFTTLDLNNDGTPDFSFMMSNTAKFSSYGYSTRARFVLKVIPQQPGNQAVLGKQSMAASAVSAGVTIGPKQKFGAGDLYMQKNSFNGLSFKSSGTWQTVEFAYVGLKIVIDGQVHYGWARIKFPYPGVASYPSIYGYAYESTPNLALVTGRTNGSEQALAPEAAPATLGSLAAGASSMTAWRAEIPMTPKSTR